MSAKCDGVSDCTHGEDERFCCEDDNQFGCYVEDDSYNPLGGGPIIRYHCLFNSSRCDMMADCLNSTIDEPPECESVWECVCECYDYTCMYVCISIKFCLN